MRNSKNISYYNLLRGATQYHIYSNKHLRNWNLGADLIRIPGFIDIKNKIFQNIELTKDKFQSNFEHF